MCHQRTPYTKHQSSVSKCHLFRWSTILYTIFLWICHESLMCRGKSHLAALKMGKLRVSPKRLPTVCPGLPKDPQGLHARGTKIYLRLGLNRNTLDLKNRNCMGGIIFEFRASQGRFQNHRATIKVLSKLDHPVFFGSHLRKRIPRALSSSTTRHHKKILRQEGIAGSLKPPFILRLFYSTRRLTPILSYYEYALLWTPNHGSQSVRCNHRQSKLYMYQPLESIYEMYEKSQSMFQRLYFENILNQDDLSCVWCCVLCFVYS